MRKILKGNLDCIGCPNYHVTILQLLYEYDTGMIKAKLARKYEISPMLVYKYIKKRKRYEKDFERTHSMEG